MMGWASCEVATAIVVESTGVFGSPEAGGGSGAGLLPAR